METQRPKVNDKFDSVWCNYFGKAQHTMVIEQMENYDSVLNGAFSPHFRTLLKTRTGEKSNKCNLCEYACSERIEDSFENTQWRKVKQIRPM